MTYNKRWQVARLLLADQIGKGELPKESDWRSWKELEAIPENKKKHDDKGIILLWAKDQSENVFQVFCFKDGLITHASKQPSPKGEGF